MIRVYLIYYLFYGDYLLLILTIVDIMKNWQIESSNVAVIQYHLLPE